MELDLDVFRTRGRAPRPVAATVVRELEGGDLALLAEEKGSQPTALKRLSDRHHALARNIAGGMEHGEAGLMSGYVASRVSILLSDPAFKELVEFYRRDVNAQYRDLHQRLSGLALDAAEELAERLEVEPEKVSIGQLLEITKMGADRTGFGPQSSTTNLNVNVDLASRLQAARERVKARPLLESPHDATINNH
jgi:hypothetical protein